MDTFARETLKIDPLVAANWYPTKHQDFHRLVSLLSLFFLLPLLPFPSLHNSLSSYRRPLILTTNIRGFCTTTTRTSLHSPTSTPSSVWIRISLKVRGREERAGRVGLC